MKRYIYLTDNNDNSVIIFGERLGKNEIAFEGKPSFFDAIRFSDSSPPYDGNYLFQPIPLTLTPNEIFHFHDPVLYQKIKLIIGHHSLSIIDFEDKINPKTVLNIFDYFLIKKGNKLLFLTDVPNNKIPKRRRNKYLLQIEQQI